MKKKIVHTWLIINFQKQNLIYELYNNIKEDEYTKVQINL